MKRTTLAIILLVFFAPALALATDVGGIINTNTTWHLAGSPYLLTSEVQIAEGVTLTIEPGVVVNTPGYTGGSGIGGTISVWGNLNAVGSESSKITFNGVWFRFRDSETKTLTMQYAEYNGGKMETDGNVYTVVIIRDSILRNVEAMWFSNIEDGSFIERNIFIKSGAMIIWTNYTVGLQKLYIRNNYFHDQQEPSQGGAIRLMGWHPELTIIEHNTFSSTNKIALRVSLTTESTQYITAINNYWNTTDTSVIDAMIYDSNDDLASKGYVVYTPFLIEPHPDTPILELNQSPTASAGPDQVVFDSVTLDGSGSFDSDGDITTWEWSLQHKINSTFNRSVTGQIITVNNLSPGFYDVYLTVSDNLGGTDTDSMLLGVAGQWDVNGDQKLGLEEIIHGLQVLSDMRP